MVFHRMRNTKPVSQVDSRQLVPGHGPRRLYDKAEAAMSSSWILEDKDAIEWKDKYEIPGWGPGFDNKMKNVGGVKQPTPGPGNLPHHACGMANWLLPYWGIRPLYQVLVDPFGSGTGPFRQKMQNMMRSSTFWEVPYLLVAVQTVPDSGTAVGVNDGPHPPWHAPAPPCPGTSENQPWNPVQPSLDVIGRSAPRQPSPVTQRCHPILIFEIRVVLCKER